MLNWNSGTQQKLTCRVFNLPVPHPPSSRNLVCLCVCVRGSSFCLNPSNLLLCTPLLISSSTGFAPVPLLSAPLDCVSKSVHRSKSRCSARARPVRTALRHHQQRTLLYYCNAATADFSDLSPRSRCVCPSGMKCEGGTTPRERESTGPALLPAGEFNVSRAAPSGGDVCMCAWSSPLFELSNMCAREREREVDASDNSVQYVGGAESEHVSLFTSDARGEGCWGPAREDFRNFACEMGPSWWLEVLELGGGGAHVWFLDLPQLGDDTRSAANVRYGKCTFLWKKNLFKDACWLGGVF